MNTRLLVAVLVAALIAIAGYQLLGTSDEGSAPPTVESEQTRTGGDPAKPATAGSPESATESVATDETADRVAVGTGSGAEYEQGVHGRIVDANGAPVPGAAVFFMEGPGSDIFTAMHLAHRGVILPPIAITESDDQGTFTVGLRKPTPDKTYLVRVTHDKHADTSVPGINLGSGQWYDAGDIRMPKGVVLHGRITVAGTGNLPIPGAKVYARALEGVSGLNPAPGRETGVETEADANGFYRFENLKIGVATVSAVAPGFAKVEKAHQRLDGKSEHLANFELPQGKSIEGIVTDSQGLPVPRARVTADAVSSKTPVAEETISDHEGRFEVLGLHDGPYQVAAMAHGFVRIETTAEAGDRGVHIVLEKQCEARLRVVAKNSRLVRNYQLSIKRYFEGQDQYGPVRTIPVQHVTERDLERGVFTMTGIDPGAYVFEVVARNHAKTYSDPFMVEIGAESPLVEVTLNDGGTLTGVVVSESGGVLAGVTVSTLQNFLDENSLTTMFGSMIPAKVTLLSATTDSRGVYTLPKLAPGTYQLKFEHPTHTQTNVKGIDVAEGRTVDMDPVTMRHGAEISGTVVIDGRPTAHCKVTITAVPDPTSKSLSTVTGEAISDSQGRYKLARRLPPGRYSARAARQTLNSPIMQVLDFAKTQREFTLASGQDTYTLDFNFQSTGTPGR